MSADIYYGCAAPYMFENTILREKNSMVRLKIQLRYRIVDNIPSTEIHRNINEYQPVFNVKFCILELQLRGRVGVKLVLVLISQFH